jgi:hypothetical protein
MKTFFTVQRYAQTSRFVHRALRFETLAEATECFRGRHENTVRVELIEWSFPNDEKVCTVLQTRR